MAHTVMNTNSDMDNFTPTVAAVREVHNITLLIRGIVYKVDSYGSQAQSIRATIDREYQLLNAFKSVFFNHEDSRLYYAGLPIHFTDNIKSVFESLRSSLAIYGLSAMKHGVSLADPPSAEPSTETTVHIQLWMKVRFETNLSKNLQQLSQSFDSVDWVLFDNEHILNLLNVYSAHAEQLREVVTLILLLTRRSGFFENWDMSTNPIGAHLGITQAAERQNRADEIPDAGFAPLPGDIIGELSYPNPHRYQTVEYDQGSSSGRIRVVLEEHEFNMQKGVYPGFSISERKDKELQSIRSLAWLLHGKATMEPLHVDRNDLKSMYTLECKGYIDRSTTNQAALVYRLPVSTHQCDTVMTLHDFINKAEENDFGDPQSTYMSKPSLGNRYFMAYALATTLFTIHSSGWLHRKIWSRGILIFPDKDRERRMPPYLVGWGRARPLEAEEIAPPRQHHEDTDLKLNIYQHPDRYYNPSAPCENRHDVYSLGVVLLEIGLWRTMAAQFAKPFPLVSGGSGIFPSATATANQLSQLAQGDALKQEMGSEYSKVVQQCLAGDFNVENDDEKNTVLTSRIRSLIVERLRYGVSL